MRSSPFLLTALMACAAPVAVPPVGAPATPPADADGDGVAEGDCDDDDPTVHPGAPERMADGVDADCDGLERCPADRDGDGLGGDDVVLVDVATGCTGPGVAPTVGDCDDDDPTVGTATAWFADDDGDGHGDPERPWSTCAPGPGWVQTSDDCDDTDRHVHPGREDVPGDGRDRDCDGRERCWVDADGDGLGTDVLVEVPAGACPEGTASASGDCDDGDPEVGALRWFADADGDGLGDAWFDVWACEAPPGHVANRDDCHDGDASLPSRWHADDDGDGHGRADAPLWACARPVGAARDGDDCDDDDDTVHPDAPERCDGHDNDCDGLVDAEDADLADGTATWPDTDGDGWGAGAVRDTCAVVHGMAVRAGDCDDRDPAAHPQAPEVPYDGVDQDCDGRDLTDVDGDGTDGGPHGLDCDDEDPTVRPGAIEVCGDGIDQDCDPDPATCGTGGSLSATDADVRLRTPDGIASVGAALAGGHDLTGDGWPDLLVGAPAAAQGRGEVFVVSATDMVTHQVWTDEVHARIQGGTGEALGTAVDVADRAGGSPVAFLGAPDARAGHDTPGAIHRIPAPLGDGDHDANRWPRVVGDLQRGLFGARLAATTPPAGTPQLLAFARTRSGPVGSAWQIHDDALLSGDWFLPEATRAGSVVATPIAPAGRTWEAVDAGPSPIFGPGALALAWRDGSDAGVLVVDALADRAPWSVDAPPPDLVGQTWALPAHAGERSLAVLLAPDLTGDGAPDLVIGDACRTACPDGGRIWVVDEGFTGALPDTAHLELVHDTPGAAFGASLAVAGDVDGDGYVDLLVGAPLGEGGSAYLVYGPLPSGRRAAEDVGQTLRGARIRGPHPDGLLGYAVAGLGDIDGDGFDDIAVGDPGAPAASGTDRGGEVAVFLGGGP